MRGSGIALNGSGQQAMAQGIVSGSKGSGTLPKMADAGKFQAPMKVEEFFEKWTTSGNNDALKSELIDRLISDNALKLEAVRKKTDLLSLLH